MFYHKSTDVKHLHRGRTHGIARKKVTFEREMPPGLEDIDRSKPMRPVGQQNPAAGFPAVFR